MKTTLVHLHEKKRRGEKIVVLTAYDYPTAVLEDEAGVDVIFVGDSVGPNVLGYASEREVTMADITHHLRAVRRGVQSAYLLADLPHHSYDTPEQALENTRVLLSHGADGVKLEGALPEVVRHLAESGIEVCGHLGYTPQTHERPGIRGKTAEAALQLVEDALLLESAGAGWIVFELVPEEVARAATERLRIPTIGIGAGASTDGQVLVVLDLLGITPFELRHNKRFEELRGRTLSAFTAYAEEVRAGRFPTVEHSRPLAPGERDVFIAALAARAAPGPPAQPA